MGVQVVEEIGERCRHPSPVCILQLELCCCIAYVGMASSTCVSPLQTVGPSVCTVCLAVVLHAPRQEVLHELVEVGTRLAIVSWEELFAACILLVCHSRHCLERGVVGLVTHPGHHVGFYLIGGGARSALPACCPTRLAGQRRNSGSGRSPDRRVAKCALIKTTQS